MIIEKWDAKDVYIDNALLNGQLEDEIYMAIPQEYAECIEQCKDNEVSSCKAILQEHSQCIVTGKLQSK